jgi:DNA-binding transcriptional MerR regulator
MNNVLPIRTTQLPPRAERDWVSAQELVAEAGITYRQFDYWCRTGLLSALKATATARYAAKSANEPGSGYVRWFGADQLAKAVTIRRLLDAGIQLSTVRDVIDQVLAEGHYDVGPVRITLTDQETA